MKISGDEMKDIMCGLARAIKIYARRYEGHGAEFDDLMQEGWLAALNLMGRCSREKLDKAIYCNLRGMVRDAAERLRRFSDNTLQMSEWAERGDGSAWIEKFAADGESADKAVNIELMCDLERNLDAKGMNIVMMLLEGYTHEEIGLDLDISQQAVSKRIAKIRLTLQHLKDW